MELISHLGIGIAAFAATNLDDLFLLLAFFADDSLRRANIVFGKLLGIAVLTGASALAALLAFAVPEGWIGLLGLVPLGLGVHRLLALRRDGPGGEVEDVRKAAQRAQARTGSQVLVVAGVSIANGGDNLGVYIPLFATALGSVPIYALVFGVMTLAWCAFAYALVHNPWFGARVRRYGHAILPVVLIGLGLYILMDARPLAWK